MSHNMHDYQSQNIFMQISNLTCLFGVDDKLTVRLENECTVSQRKWVKYKHVAATIISRQSVTEHMSTPCGICYLRSAN